MRKKWLNGLVTSGMMAGLMIGASVPAPASGDQAQLSAQEIAAACAEQSSLYDEIIKLQQRQALVRQIVGNYGFQNTVAEFDAASAFLSERERSLKPPPPRKQLYHETVSRGKTELKNYIETLQRTPDAVGGMSPQFVEMLRKLPMPAPLRNQILQLASDPATRLRGYAGALEWIDTFMLPVELMEAAEDGPAPLAWKGFMEAVSVVSPAYGGFLKVVDWAGTNLYNAATGRWTAHQINVLTASTEADLLTLKQRTDELAAITRRLSLLNQRAPELAKRCDTTRLTQRPAGTQQAPVSSTGGGAAGTMTKVLLVTALTAGGSYAAMKYLVPKDCGEAPLDDYYALCPGGAACSSVRREYGDWCVCNGYSGFDGNACY